MNITNLKKILTLSFLIVLVSCAARKVRDEGDLISSLYKSNDYKSVVEKINKGEVYKREEDRFLKQAELGIAYFNLKDYDNALLYLNNAKEIANELYKISITNKVESLFIGEATDIYYPNQFEQANIRFYEILAHYMKSKEVTSDKKRRFHQQAMVSTLRDWSAYIENFKEQNRGRAIYKGSTFIDLMGVVVHDTYGRAKDRSIVNNFKKIGKRDLIQQMGLYPSYNSSHKKYQEDYKKLHLMSQSELSKYITKTETYKSTYDFFNSRKSFNTYIIILNGHVIKKTAKVYDFPLGLPVGVYISNDEGMDDFVTFSLNMLALTRGAEPKIYFELPKIDSTTVSTPKKIIIKNANGEEQESGSSVLMTNTSEVLSSSLKNDVALLEAKVGARLAAKHIALLTSAYQTYRSLYNNGNLIAYLSASAAYAAGNRAIQESELADLRSWYGIYDHIHLYPVNLEPGEYELLIDNKKYKFNRDDGAKQIVPLIIK
ncbi:hypothetical protein M902_1433 [Bacteriovorax sp. BAL6_X]|uniref:hypothetical protein n=1 Tax=Bacteriovorax sp. BAL6_X TaxID=1201290 RepID=UPI000386C90F|nr:hypothetical protein [Bacteriovorax sp. BAL6_X]EPZ50367.1 hypothetical protein M902_1433 [Bacteriovorax sp. BAL6_X]